jgi:hypothetical protein
MKLAVTNSHELERVIDRECKQIERSVPRWDRRPRAVKRPWIVGAMQERQPNVRLARRATVS